MAIWIDPDKCNGCGMCSRSCPYQALDLENKKARWLENRCTLCGACLESCKFEALGGDVPVREVPDFSDYRNVWVFVEQRNRAFHDSAFELLGCARSLADELGEEVVAAAVGESVLSDAHELIRRGADR